MCSIAGLTITKTRAIIESEAVDQIIFIKKNIRGVVSTGPLARGHLIWPPGHLLLDSTGPDWPPAFKA